MKPNGNENPPGVGGDREPARDSFGYANYSTIGLQFALLLILSVFAGHWADQRWGLAPWGLLAGAFFGFAGGTLWMYMKIYPSADSKKNTTESDGR